MTDLTVSRLNFVIKDLHSDEAIILVIGELKLPNADFKGNKKQLIPEVFKH